MRRKTTNYFAGALAAGCLAALNVHALTAGALSRQLAEGTKVTVVDVRSTALFTQGHIPGAINIPAELCASQKLPPIGSVVVCGSGLGKDLDESAAAAALAAKSGITVQILEGGYAAWESSQNLTTQSRGVKAEIVNYISYAQLKAAKPADTVLVDLRKPAVAKSNAAAATAQPLTDLAGAFPGFQVTQTPSAPKAQGNATGASSGAPPLLVLIDNGDGVALDVARKLQASGNHRYAVLAGGELILARQGQAGSQRVNAGTHSTTTLPQNAPGK